MAPEVSLQFAARHLLRHIDNADALRSNWLAARFFQPTSKSDHESILADRKGLARVRAAIIAALEDLGMPSPRVEHARQRSIVLRSHLGGEGHKQVAADLGISIRQLYRDLRQARTAIARTLAKISPEPIFEAMARPTDVDVRMDYVEALAMIGRFDEAISGLRTLAKDLPHATDRVRIWCELVHAACDAGRLMDAREALVAACQTRLLLADFEPDRTEIDAAIELANGVVAWRTGEPTSAMRSNERVAALLRTSRKLSARENSLLALALVKAGCQYSACGRSDKALVVLQQAQELLGTSVVSRSSVHVNYYNSLGAVHALMPGGTSSAVALFHKAYTMGREAGALRGAAEAAGNLCGIHLWRGELGEAISYGKAGLTLASSVCGEDEFALMAGTVSHAHAMANQSKDALALASVAQARATPGSLESALGLVAEAAALISAREFSAAAHAADRAVEKMVHLGVQRFVGAALRIKAEAHDGIHQRSEATESIRGAIDILEKHGHPFSLAGAYSSSARITGNVSHAAQARGLFETLQR